MLPYGVPIRFYRKANPLRMCRGKAVRAQAGDRLQRGFTSDLSTWCAPIGRASSIDRDWRNLNRRRQLKRPSARGQPVGSCR